MKDFTFISAVADENSDADPLARLLSAVASTQIVLTPMQCASDKRNLPLLKTIMATAEKIGLKIESDKKIDTIALNRALAEGVNNHRIFPSTRWEFKAQLSQLHLI
jgi:hypothetical protein